MRPSQFAQSLFAVTLASSSVTDFSAEAGHMSLLQTRAVLRDSGSQKNDAAFQPMPIGSLSRFASSDLEHVKVHPHLSYHEARGLFGGRTKHLSKHPHDAFLSEQQQIASESEWEDAVEKIALDTVAKDAAERDRLSEEAMRSAEKEATEMQDEDAGGSTTADSVADAAASGEEQLADKEAIALDAEVDKIAAERLEHSEDDRSTDSADCDPTGCPRDDLEAAAPQTHESRSEGRKDLDDKEETEDGVGDTEGGSNDRSKNQHGHGDDANDDSQENQEDLQDRQALNQKELLADQSDEDVEIEQEHLVEQENEEDASQHGIQEVDKQVEQGAVQSDVDVEVEREHFVEQEYEEVDLQDESWVVGQQEEQVAVKSHEDREDSEDESEKEHASSQQEDLQDDQGDLNQQEVQADHEKREVGDHAEVHDYQQEIQEMNREQELDLGEQEQQDENVEQEKRDDSSEAVSGESHADESSTKHVDETSSLLADVAGVHTDQDQMVSAHLDAETTSNGSHSIEEVVNASAVPMALNGKKAGIRTHKGLQEDVDTIGYQGNSTAWRNRSSSVVARSSGKNVTNNKLVVNKLVVNKPVGQVGNATGWIKFIPGMSTGSRHHSAVGGMSLSLSSAHSEVGSWPERHASISNHSSSVSLAPGAYYIINAKLQKYLNTLGSNASVWHRQNLSAKEWPKGLLWKFEPVANRTNTFAIGSVEHESYLTSDEGLADMWKPLNSPDASVGGPSKVQWKLLPVNGQESTFYFVNAEHEMYMSSFGGMVSTWRGKNPHDLGSQPGNMQWIVVRAETEETSACDVYASEAPGCSWTAKWSCPGQPRGSKGATGPHSHNSTGYRCCCRLGLWSAPRPWVGDARATSSAALESMGGQLANVTEVVQDLHDELKTVVAKASSSSPQPTTSNVSEVALPPLAFIKTHRTGSSVVANIVQRIGDARRLSFILPSGGRGHAHSLGWPSLFPGPEAVTFNGLAANQFDIICNNAVYNGDRMREFLKLTPEPLFFTVIRKPVAQTQSAFQFNRAPCGPSWSERIAWLENISDGGDAQRTSMLRAQFQNPQAHDLGWYENADVRGDVDHDDQKIQTWLDDLEAKFGLVILQDFLEEGLVLLKHHLGLSTADVMHLDFKRSTDAEKQGKPTDQQAAAIDGLQSVDAALYHRFSQVFWRKWGEAGGKVTLAPQLAELRTANAKLAKDCAGAHGGGPGDPAGDSNKCLWRFRADTAEYTELLRGERLGANAASLF